MSRNYNTMGTISKERYKDLINEMPEIERYFKKHLYKYEDKKETFMKDMMSKITYFKESYGINESLTHEIMYKFEIEYHNAGETILRENDEIEDIIIVSHGNLEVYTEFEGNKFVIENLWTGSILNYKTIFTADIMQTNVACTENTYLLKLKKSKLEAIA